MSHRAISFGIIVVLAFGLAACDQFTSQSNVTVEQADAYKPNLPPVPKIAPPRAPEVYPDGSYSIYGLRKKIGATIEQQIFITAFINEMYEKPDCPKGRSCRTLMPHLFLADEKDEPLERRRIRLVGFGQSFKEIEEAARDAKKRRKKPAEEDPFAAKVVWDWQQGHQYKITAKFTRRSKEGFMDNEGLLEYHEHTCLDCPTDEEEAAK